jgi:hypothetical protein
VSRRRRALTPDFYGRFRLAPFATNAAPGTEEKIAVLEKRAEMRVSLFRPLDAAY